MARLSSTLVAGMRAALRPARTARAPTMALAVAPLRRASALAGAARLPMAAAAGPRLLPSHTPARCYASDSPDVRSAIDSMVKDNKLMLFMKGTPDMPMCGFSKAVCQILDLHGVDFEKIKTFNVLENEAVRQGIKEYSEWPTIPQVYMNGEFVGGCDIMIQMHQDGSLVKALHDIGIESTFDANGEEES